MPAKQAEMLATSASANRLVDQLHDAGLEAGHLALVHLVLFDAQGDLFLQSLVVFRHLGTPHHDTLHLHLTVLHAGLALIDGVAMRPFFFILMVDDPRLLLDLIKQALVRVLGCFVCLCQLCHALLAGCLRH